MIYGYARVSTKKQLEGNGLEVQEKALLDAGADTDGEELAVIYVTGPLFAGKQDYIQKALGLGDAAFAARAVRDVQELVPCEDLALLADRLARYEIVIQTEIGGGIVPMDQAEREKREAAGRLGCLLAQRADTVIRVCCGLPQLLKGEWP